jgi:nitroimidazol reductase NimA-like FMN-containing flavoprotein (pyridoxamine 5'-phosphate oxidase superfamily)
MTEVPEDLAEAAMDEADAAAYLRGGGSGVLTLADGNEAYGVPVSYGFDGDRVYVAFLLAGERSRKERLAEATEWASLVVYDVVDREDWRSVVAAGPLRPIDDDEWDHARETMAETAWYPSVFRESAPTRGVSGYVIEVESLTGRTAD